MSVGWDYLSRLWICLNKVAMGNRQPVSSPSACRFEDERTNANLISSEATQLLEPHNVKWSNMVKPWLNLKYDFQCLATIALPAKCVRLEVLFLCIWKFQKACQQYVCFELQKCLNVLYEQTDLKFGALQVRKILVFHLRECKACNPTRPIQEFWSNSNGRGIKTKGQTMKNKLKKVVKQKKIESRQPNNIFFWDHLK